MQLLKIKLLLVGLLLLLVQSCSYLPEEVEVAAGVSLKETAAYIQLSPSSVPSKPTGLMFYSGGLVAPQAYMDNFYELVQQGITVVILKPTANLAIMDVNKSEQYLDDFDGVSQWVIGGHSLGAVVASMDVYKSKSNYVGMVLMAGFPAESSDLSDWGGTVLSLFAEKDALATPEDIDANKHLLPNSLTISSLVDMPITSTRGTTIYHQILGGNHAQFGNYGTQNGDGEATITRTQQRQEISDFIQAFYIANGWL